MNNDEQVIGQTPSDNEESSAIAARNGTAVADDPAEVIAPPPTEEEEFTPFDVEADQVGDEVEAVAAAPPEGEEAESAVPDDGAPVAPAEVEMPVSEPTDQELFLAALDGDMPSGKDLEDFMFTPLERGQIVEGAVARITSTEILVDVGTKTEGIISGREMERLDPEMIESLEVGQDVFVYVLNPEDQQGHPRLSLARALEEQDWREAERYMKEAEVYHGKINGFNKGGLIVRFGKVPRRSAWSAAAGAMAERRRNGGAAWLVRRSPLR